MAVYDRWHKSHPQEYDKPCRCGRGKNKLYPSSDHLRGPRWQVRWYDDEDRQRKRNFRERYGPDPEQHAEAFDADNQAKLNSDSYIHPDAGKVSLQDYAKQWRSGLTADLSSLENIDRRLAHIINIEAGPRTRRPEGESLIAGEQLRKLAKRPSLIQQWIKGLERKGLSPGYIKMIVDTLSSIMIAAMDDGLIQRNPVKADSVHTPRLAKRRIVPWTRPMVAAATAELGDIGLMAGIGAGAGLRQGEVFGLAVDDIDWLGRDRMIRVVRIVKEVGGGLVFAPPKGDKERAVPLSDALALSMAAYLEAHDPVEITLPWRRPDATETRTAKLFFARGPDEPWHRNVFTYWWHKARAAAGAPPTRQNGFHVLRHTYASVQLAGGTDIRALAEFIGHSDPGFTLRIYAHFMPGGTDKARRAMDAWWLPGDGSSALDMPDEAAE